MFLISTNNLPYFICLNLLLLIHINFTGNFYLVFVAVLSCGTYTFAFQLVIQLGLAVSPKFDTPSLIASVSQTNRYKTAKALVCIINLAGQYYHYYTLLVESKNELCVWTVCCRVLNTPNECGWLLYLWLVRVGFWADLSASQYASIDGLRSISGHQMILEMYDSPQFVQSELSIVSVVIHLLTRHLIQWPVAWRHSVCHQVRRDWLADKLYFFTLA